MRHGFGTFREYHASMRDDFGTFRDHHASMRDDFGTFRDNHACMNDNSGTSGSAMHVCLRISEFFVTAIPDIMGGFPGSVRLPLEDVEVFCIWNELKFA